MFLFEVMDVIKGGTLLRRCIGLGHRALSTMLVQFGIGWLSDMCTDFL